MNDTDFAHQAMSWIDPLEVRRCGARLANDRKAALSRQALIVASGELSDGTEAAFDKLVAKFLRGFKLPFEVLAVMVLSRQDVEFAEQDLKWLKELRLEPRMMVCDRSKPTRGVPPSTILAIQERDVVLDLIRDPVMALLDIVTLYARTWREMRKLGVNAFHDPAVFSPYFCYVERQVAESYVQLLPAPHLTSQSGPNIRYRAVTSFGVPAIESAMNEATKKMARMQAQSTWTPLTKGDT